MSTLETVSARFLVQLGANVTAASIAKGKAFAGISEALAVPADRFDVSPSGARIDRDTAASHLCFYRQRGAAMHDLVLTLPRHVSIAQARACLAAYIAPIDALIGDNQDPFTLVATLITDESFRLNDMLVISFATLRGQGSSAGLPLSVTLS